MTNDQIVLMDFFKTVRSLSGGEGSKELFMASHVAHLLHRFPFSSEVKTELRGKDKEVFIVDADEKIFDLIGYTPDELKGKPLSFIMEGKLNTAKQKRILYDLNTYGVAVKTNKNKHKDGSIVDTFGWIFNMGTDSNVEVVMDVKNIIGYVG